MFVSLFQSQTHRCLRCQPRKNLSFTSDHASVACFASFLLSSTSSRPGINGIRYATDNQSHGLYWITLRSALGYSRQVPATTSDDFPPRVPRVCSTLSAYRVDVPTASVRIVISKVAAIAHEVSAPSAIDLWICPWHSRCNCMLQQTAALTGRMGALPTHSAHSRLKRAPRSVCYCTGAFHTAED